MTKRSDRVIVDLVGLVAPFKTRGLNGSVFADDSSYEVGFEVLLVEVSRRNWISSKVIVGVVADFDVEVLGEMVIEVATSSLAGGGLCDVAIGGNSTEGELFDA